MFRFASVIYLWLAEGSVFIRSSNALYASATFVWFVCIKLVLQFAHFTLCFSLNLVMNAGHEPVKCLNVKQSWHVFECVCSFRHGLAVTNPGN